MKNSSSKRWFEKYPKTTFILFTVGIIVLLDFLSAQIFIPEDYNSFRGPNPYFHHGLLPNQAAKNKWGDKVFSIYTNSLGFKDQQCRQVKTISHKKRILFIGDSFTEGVGMTWEESFVGILDRAFSGIEILNASTVSYSPKLYYLKIRYLIENLSFQFDELYVCIDNSDVMDEITYQSFSPYPDNRMKKTGYKLRNYLFENSYIFYTGANHINKRKRNTIAESWNPFSGAAIVDESAAQDEDFITATLDWSYIPEKYNKWGIEGLELAARNMNFLVDLCKSNDIKVNVVIYPWPNLIQRKDLNNVQVKFWESFCEKSNIRLVNLYPDFIPFQNETVIINRYFIPGDVHWNEEGNAFVAELLLDHITQ
jgi:hypothetical protein